MHAHALLRLVVMVVALVVHVADVAGVRMGRRRRAVVAVHLLLVVLMVLVMVVRMPTMVDGVVLRDRRDRSTLSKLLPCQGGALFSPEQVWRQTGGPCCIAPAENLGVC